MWLGNITWISLYYLRVGLFGLCQHGGEMSVVKEKKQYFHQANFPFWNFQNTCIISIIACQLPNDTMNAYELSLTENLSQTIKC
jgi:hypothetical protein